MNFLYFTLNLIIILVFELSFDDKSNPPQFCEFCLFNVNSLILKQGYENILKTEISTKKYSLLKYCLYCKMIVVDVLTNLCNDYSEAFLHK